MHCRIESMEEENDNGIKKLLLSESREEPKNTADQTFDWLGRPTLNRNLGGSKAAYFVLGNTCLWYIGYFGIYFNMVLFFKKALHFDTAAAARDTTNWFGSMFMCSFIGAFVAESFLGRFWTTVVFQVVNLMGTALTAFVTSLITSEEGSSSLVVFLYISLYLMALGTGAFQSALMSLGADQFDADEDKSVYFGRYLVVNNVGLACANTIIVYIVNSEGWAFGYWTCAGAGLLALTIFAIGTPTYRQYIPRGNSFSRGIQVLVAATRKWDIPAPSENDLLYEVSDQESSDQRRHKILHSDSFRWLDKAATMAPGDLVKDTVSNPWALCTVTQVEEVKCICRILPVWLSTIFLYTVYAQAGTLFVEQGAAMKTDYGYFVMQPATMNMFNIVTVVVFPVIYDRIVVPCSRLCRASTTATLSPLQRIGLGYILSLTAISMAAIVETRRLIVAKKERQDPNPHASVPVSIFWLTPQFLLLGAAQYFLGVGLMEFFYSQSPTSMRSLGSSFSLACSALGSYVSSILVSAVSKLTGRGSEEGWIPKDINRGHLNYFYVLLSVLSVFNYLFFVRCASRFGQVKGGYRQAAARGDEEAVADSAQQWRRTKNNNNNNNTKLQVEEMLW